MAEKKTKLDLKGLKNLFGTKKSSINMDDKNEDPNFDTENSHLDDVNFFKKASKPKKYEFRTKNPTENSRRGRVMKGCSRTSESWTRKSQRTTFNSFSHASRTISSSITCRLIIFFL